MFPQDPTLFSERFDDLLLLLVREEGCRQAQEELRERRVNRNRKSVCVCVTTVIGTGGGYECV